VLRHLPAEIPAHYRLCAHRQDRQSRHCAPSAAAT